MKRLLQLAAVAIGVWALVAAGIAWSRAQRPTPEKIARYLAARPDLAQLSAAQRAQTLTQVANDLNRLDLDQRQKFRGDQGPFAQFFTQLTPAERSDFLDRTLPEGFRQMMVAFNQMPPEQRQRLIRRTLDDLNKAESSGARPPTDAMQRAETQKIINQGLESFYNDANADVKLEMAPVIERLQQVMQNFR